MIGGRYTLVREVGRGGMGAVFLARDELLHREVAVKRLGNGALDLTRAAREARLAASLNHPHVVAVFDLVEDAGERWLVMEYVAGRTLAAMAADAGSLPSAQVARLLAQAAEALAAAHAGGIVHRDVKPSNMLVTADGRLKLTDFGIARAHGDATMTETGMVAGSPGYLSPEVARGERATASSDVWSLGASAYHAVTGRPPYLSAGNPIATLYQVVHQDPPRLPAAHPLSPLLIHTMASDPVDRWTMDRVHDFLTSLDADTVGSAAPAAVSVPTPSPPPADPTQVLAVRPPASEATPEATSTVVAARRREPTAVAEPRRRRPVPPVAAAAAVLAVLLVVVWAVTQLDSGGGTASGPAGARGSGPSASASALDPSRTPGATAEDLRDFVSAYLATATTDPKSSWGMLTPAFQDASGGYGQYKKFWKGQKSASLRSFRAEPGRLIVEYDVRYRRAAGDIVDDHVVLRLVRHDGGYLIDGEF